jgi:hypothetical protein
LQAPADAAFAKISLAIDTTGTNALASTLDVYEIRLLTAEPMVLLGSRDSGYGPAAIFKTSDSIILMPNVPETWTASALNSTRLRVSLIDTLSPQFDIRSDLGETVLSVGGYVSVGPATSTSTVFGVSDVPGEATSRFAILASGKQEFGDGINAYDTNLYRSAADTLKTDDSLVIGGTLTGAGVTTNLHHGITLQRTTNLTVNTSLDASATAITWSSAVKNTSLYAYWSSGSTIAIPLTGWYSITCHLISGTGLGTGFAFRLYALVNGTVIAETETQAGANTTSDTFSISTIAYMTAADSLVFRASASSASKTIGGSRRSACSVVYLGNTSA